MTSLLKKFTKSTAVLLVLSLVLSVFPQFIFAEAPSSSKAFLSFSVEGNPGIIDEDNHTISVTVPYRSAVNYMLETFTISGASVLNHSSNVTRNDYSSPVVLTVVAEDNSTQDYTVTVTIGPSNLKSIFSFNLLNPPTTGFIDDEAFAVFLTVPQGTDVTNLKPSFTTDDGAIVKVNGNTQTSGVTAQDFTNPVTYTVVALDSSTRDYRVTVNLEMPKSTAKEITYFGLDSLSSIGIIEPGQIIFLTVPYGTDRSSLVPTFNTTGQRVVVNGVQQVSGEGVQNFNIPVIYSVYDEAGGVNNYLVVVIEASSNASLTKQLLTFNVAGVDGIVNESDHTISVVLPNGFARNNQTATFTTNGQSVRVGGIIQTSNVTLNDFTKPVTYTVFAENGLTQNYVVTVKLENQITSYDLIYPIHATGIINESNKTIAFNIPYGTDLSATKAVYVTKGDHLSIHGVVQDSGVTETDLSASPTIHAVDSDNNVIPYAVILNVGLNPAKELTSFRLTSPESMGVVDQSKHTVSMTVPYGTNVAALAPIFTFTGSKVKVGPHDQVSGVTKQNFTSPVTYSVYATDGTWQDYVVKVTVTAIGTDTGSGTITTTTTTGPTSNSQDSSITTETEPPAKPQATVFTPVVNLAEVEEFLKGRIEQLRMNPISNSFSDVNKHWSKLNIDVFVKLGVISGYEDGTFHPDASITRAEFSTIIAKVFHIGTVNNSDLLKDVKDHWASSEIAALASNGIIKGYKDGTFKPDKTISRAEIIAILGRIVDLNAIEKHQDASFKDVDGSWNANEIKAAASSGLIKGRNAGTFAPNEPSSRAEALTILLRALHLNPSIKSLLDQL